MAVTTIKIKRGSEANVLNTNLQVGELALALDTSTVYGYNGSDKFVVGKAIIDTYDQMTSYSGVDGRFFYAQDNGFLYISYNNNWFQTTSALSGTGGILTSSASGTWTIDGSSLATKQQLLTTSGNIISQLAPYATQTWVNTYYPTDAEMDQEISDVTEYMLELLTSMSGTVTIQAARSPYLIQVGPNLPVTNIQEGIDLCDTSEGNYYVVQVFPGYYQEDIILKDNVDLVGVNYSACILEGSVSWPATTCTPSGWSCILDMYITATSSEPDYALVTIEEGNHDLNNLWLVLTMESAAGSVVKMSGGELHGYLPEYQYFGIGDTTVDSVHRVFQMTGGYYQEQAGELFAEVEDSVGRVVGYCTRSIDGEAKVLLVNPKISVKSLSPTFSGMCVGIGAVNDGLGVIIEAGFIRVDTISGGTGTAFYLEGSQIGASTNQVISNANRIEVEGFDLNYSVMTTSESDMWVSHFDTITAADGLSGSPYTVAHVHSDDYGELHLNKSIRFTPSVSGTAFRDLMVVDMEQGTSPHLSIQQDAMGYPGLVWRNPGGSAAFNTRAYNDASLIGVGVVGPGARDYRPTLSLSNITDENNPATLRSYSLTSASGTQDFEIRRIWDGMSYATLLNMTKDGLTKLRYGSSVDRFLDESDMASYSPQALPTQRSVVDYVDTISGSLSSDATALRDDALEYVNAYIKPYRYLSVSVSGGDFQSIQAAIDSINITDFESEYWAIQVHPGIYYEDIYLKDNVDLVADSYDSCMVEGSVNWLSSSGCSAGYWSAIQNITVQAHTSVSGFSAIYADAGEHDIVNCYTYLETEGVGANCVELDGGNIFSYLTMYEYSGVGDSPGHTHRCIRGTSGRWESQADVFLMEVEDSTDSIVCLGTQRSPEPLDYFRFQSASADVFITTSGYSGDCYLFRCRGTTHRNSAHGCRIRVTGPGTGHCEAFHVSSPEVGLSDGNAHSSSNRFIIEDFEHNHFAYVSSADLLMSHFDDIVCDIPAIHGDVANYFIVNSEVDGQLRVTHQLKVGNTLDQNQGILTVDIGKEEENPKFYYDKDYFGYCTTTWLTPSGGQALLAESSDGPVLVGSMSRGPNAFNAEQRLSTWAHVDGVGPLGFERRGYRLKRKTDESFAISRHWTYLDGGDFVDLLNIDHTGGLRLRNSDVRVSAILDEDNMISNTASGIPTQQSVKAYVDNTEQMIHTWVGLQNYTVSGTIPLNLYGDSTFGVSGTLITHNLNNIDHFTGVTPTVTGASDAIKVGVVYVSRDINTDMVYTTGGPDSAGLPFMWQVTGMFMSEPPPASPLAVYNCRLWLVSDRGITIAGGDDGVSYWADQAPFGHDLGNSFEYYRPTLTANYINGHPALCFDDGYEPLFWEGYGNDRGWGVGEEEWECYIVMKDAGTFSWGYFIYAPFVTISLYNSYPSIRFADGNIISTHSISSMSIVRLRWNANSGWVSVNNAEEETMSGRTPVGRTIWESLDFDMQALCYVPEIVAFPRFLDGDEHAYMNDYLSSRYDITLS